MNAHNDFVRYRLKHRQIDTPNNTKVNCEVLTTLLSAVHNDKDTTKAAIVEKFLENNIYYNDLASLRFKDLELLGIASENKRNDLLKCFAQLPNQNPSYDKICHSNESINYNNHIIKNTNSHLEALCSALAAITYKLQIMIPKDALVDEKSYASVFMIKALNELIYVTNDINKAANSSVTDLQHLHRKIKWKGKKKILIFSSSIFCVGILIAIWHGKFTK